MAEILTNEEIEKVSGGAEVHDPHFYSMPEFKFEKSEIKKLEDHGITGITDGVWYSRLELNDKGIAGCTKDDILGQLALYGILCVTA
jgi:hypothetical protein